MHEAVAVPEVEPHADEAQIQGLRIPDRLVVIAAVDLVDRENDAALIDEMDAV